MIVLIQVIIAKNGSTNNAQDKAASEQKLRELRTLKAHYYPEGGWGWVILTVASLVHLLVVGSQVVLSSIIISLGPRESAEVCHEDHPQRSLYKL